MPGGAIFLAVASLASCLFRKLLPPGPTQFVEAEPAALDATISVMSNVGSAISNATVGNASSLGNAIVNATSSVASLVLPTSFLHHVTSFTTTHVFPLIVAATDIHWVPLLVLAVLLAYGWARVQEVLLRMEQEQRASRRQVDDIVWHVMTGLEGVVRQSNKLTIFTQENAVSQASADKASLQQLCSLTTELAELRDSLQDVCDNLRADMEDEDEEGTDGSSSEEGESCSCGESEVCSICEEEVEDSGTDGDGLEEEKSEKCLIKQSTAASATAAPPHVDKQFVSCYSCGKHGHASRDCPSNALTQAIMAKLTAAHNRLNNQLQHDDTIDKSDKVDAAGADNVNSSALSATSARSAGSWAQQHSSAASLLRRRAPTPFPSIADDGDCSDAAVFP